MKRVLICILIALILLLSACSSGAGSLSAVSPSPTAILSGNNNGGNPPGGSSNPPQSASGAQTPAVTTKSNLYDPSIFIIQASGKFRQELAPGYYADYEAELYLNKVDSNNNRVTVGSYQGFFWMNCTLDTKDFIKDMIKNAPISVQFDAGGEVLSDNLAISLNTEDDKAWVDYNIKDKDGNALPLTRDTPVAKGSFVAIAKDVYLKAKARGAQGEKVDYEKTGGSEETDISYIIHVQPDSAESNSQRKVVIYMTCNGTSFTLDGTLRRIPGYPDDVLKYANSGEYQNALNNHLK